MAKHKRQREDIVPDHGDGDLHPARQKRLKRTQDGAELATMYEDLANEVQDVRIQAAAKLLKAITQAPEGLEERLEAAELRLTRGLCSGRKAARVGFSTALAEVFRLKFKRNPGTSGGLLLKPTLRNIVQGTESDGNVGGQERRDHLLGRCFAYQAVLHSDVGLREDLDASQWSTFLDAVLTLANEKVWLRRDVGTMLRDYLVSPAGSGLADSRVEMLMESAGRKKLLRTAEGIGLWLTVRRQFPSASLPLKVWHHNDPMSKHEHQAVAKIMLDASDDEPAAKRSGSRQASPSFAWTTIFQQANDEHVAKRFEQFWPRFLSLVFSTTSSTERKALCLQIFSVATTEVPTAILAELFQPSVMNCILDQRAKADNHLFGATKVTLNSIAARAKRDPSSAGIIITRLIAMGLSNLDQQTKTKTIESILTAADEQSLTVIVGEVQHKFDGYANGGDTSTDVDIRSLADLLLTVARINKTGTALLTKKMIDQPTWLENLLESLPIHAFGSAKLAPLLQPKLMSILNTLMSGPLQQALQAPVAVVQSLRNSKNALQHLEENAGVAVGKAWTCMDKMSTNGTVETLIPGNEAFALLFALSILQCFRKEPDAVAALEDLITCYESKDDGDDSTAMIIELLLSFISKPSALFRKLAEQVFTAFAPELTADSLQSLIDILGQKESLSGQQELFDANADGDEESVDGSSDDDIEVIDAEDASDVEIVNGDQASESSSDGDSSDVDDVKSASDAEAGAANSVEDEETAFDRKLAEALGTDGMEEDDSDDDGSDMDDEQMMALEPHLTSIFKERSKTTSKKQDKKDAKENIVNFKNRVLDLLAIYVRTQYGKGLTLDLILPLATLVRTTTNKQTGEKAFAVLKQYFDTSSKNKQIPQSDDAKALFRVLEAIHDELKLGGSKLHASACSRSSLFLAKVLTAEDPTHYEQIASMYAQLASEWWQDPKSKVHPSVFTEWTSWSITTRKQA